MHSLLRPAAILLAVALGACTGCGASTGNVGSAEPSSSLSRHGPDKPDAPTPTPAIVVARTGGIAGVIDMVRIAADGTASITAKTGKSRKCTPAPTALDRLRAIDLAALGATPSRPPGMADAFNYTVKSTAGTATASEGDDDSRRADLVDAAAAVIASCLASQSGSGSAAR